MKTIKILLTITMAAALLFSCQNNTPVESSPAAGDVTMLSKGNDTEHQNYPQYTSTTFRFKNGWYDKGSMSLPNGSTFSVGVGELYPPTENMWGEDITLTMSVDYDERNNELIYTFGPSGTTFHESFPAELILDYSLLGTDRVKLYYLTGNGRQEMEGVKFTGNRAIFYISHFSRYAIGTEY